MQILQCKKCGHRNEQGSSYCALCGHGDLLAVEPLKSCCPECGEKIRDQQSFCPHCGASLKKQLDPLGSALLVAIIYGPIAIGLLMLYFSYLRDY